MFAKFAGMTADALYVYTFASPQCACSDVWISAASTGGLDLQHGPILAHVGLDWVAIKEEPGLAGALHPADSDMVPVCIRPAGRAGKGWWDRSGHEGVVRCSVP